MNTQNIKNIAVIVAGIDEEYQNNIISGINDFTRENNINTSYFAAFGGVLANGRFDIGEYNIYNLINFSKFDGAILLTNTVSALSERKRVYERIKESGIPAVVLDCDDYPEFYNISIDNTAAMRDMVGHVIEKHGAKTINFISGPLANPEACDRYEAFCSVMKEHGLTVDEDRIFFGEFRGIDGKKAVDYFLESGLTMPDAIICANDAMALSAVNTLEKAGYKVPRDVIVTGFDNTYNAQHYSPAISSVSRPLYEAGCKACEIVLGLLEGKEYDKNTVLTASPVFSESCGCCKEESAEDLKNYKKTSYKLLDNCRSGISLLNRMTSALPETETAEDNFRVISQFMEELECEKCSICLCSDWEGTFKEAGSDTQDDNYNVTGYTRTMSAPLVWDKGVFRTVSSFLSQDMFPEPLTTGGNISYFLPLHFRERCLGYYIITNSDFPIKSMLCHSLIMNISNSIENIRKLLHLNNAIFELDKLYVIDPLCDIYNRNGFIRVTASTYQRCIKENRPIMIAFIDMDGLKIINDHYGHNEGDFALRRLARIISDCCNENLVCARFGGDEFIIFGTDMNEEDAEEIEKRFIAKLAEANAIIKKPYELAASIGTFITTVGPDTPLFKIITKADEKMYEQKKRKKTSRYLRRS